MELKYEGMNLGQLKKHKKLDIEKLDNKTFNHLLGYIFSSSLADTIKNYPELDLGTVEKVSEHLGIIYGWDCWKEVQDELKRLEENRR